MTFHPEDTLVCGVCTHAMTLVDEYTFWCGRCTRTIYWYRTSPIPEPGVRAFLQREWERDYDEHHMEADQS